MQDIGRGKVARRERRLRTLSALGWPPQLETPTCFSFSRDKPISSTARLTFEFQIDTHLACLAAEAICFWQRRRSKEIGLIGLIG
jgi:hypothetical protein